MNLKTRFSTMLLGLGLAIAPAFAIAGECVQCNQQQGGYVQQGTYVVRNDGCTTGECGRGRRIFQRRDCNSGQCETSYGSCERRVRFHFFGGGRRCGSCR